MAKPRGISLHIGVNDVDATHYAGWKGELVSCENDADDMAAIAKSRGMKAKVLHGKAATREALLKALHEAGKQLREGDFFFLSFSGYGGQVLDVSGDEIDLMDETWCLYDAQVIDDEIQAAILGFARGVRVLVVSDSTPSGSVLRPYVPDPDPPPAGQRQKLLPPLIADKIYRRNSRFYDELQLKLKARVVGADSPGIILLQGCQHNQASIDGKDNGVFSKALLGVWNQASYQGNYVRFFAHIVTRMPATQTPMMSTYGLVGDFVLQQPFTLA